MAIVDGRLQSRKWDDKDGNKHTAVEVIADSVYFGDSKRQESNESPASYSTAGGMIEVEDDGNLPF